jgi:hypothetical protein
MLRAVAVQSEQAAIWSATIALLPSLQRDEEVGDWLSLDGFSELR